MQQPLLSDDLSVGERVRVKDKAEDAWKFGTVAKLSPLEVKPEGWPNTFKFKFVEKITDADAAPPAGDTRIDVAPSDSAAPPAKEAGDGDGASRFIPSSMVPAILQGVTIGAGGGSAKAAAAAQADAAAAAAAAKAAAEARKSMEDAHASAASLLAVSGDAPTTLPTSVEVTRLIAQKKVAVMREDFATAKALKMQIDILSKSGEDTQDPELSDLRARNSAEVNKFLTSIEQLQVQQKAAVASENFAEAQQIKEKIDRFVLASKKVGRQDLDIIQFTSPLYFVEVNEGSTKIDIMRLGSMAGLARCRYFTADSSGRAGKLYKETKGELVFQDGETVKTIEIPIIDDGYWATTLEFKVCIVDPEECELGLYLHTCRIKVLNNQNFPSAKFKDAMARIEDEGQGPIEELNSIKLWKSYLALVYHIPGIAWRTILTLILSQTPNLYLLFQLQANIYLVDGLFKEKVLENSEEPIAFIIPGFSFKPVNAAILLGLLYIAPMFLCHYWEYRKVLLDIGAITREYLQGSLIRKYLNYTEESRRTAKPAIMQVSILTDTGDLAAGYEKTLSFVGALGKTALLCLFILKENKKALSSVIAMPCIMITWVIFRTKPLNSAMDFAHDKLAELAEMVEETCSKYSLIAEYGQRPLAAERFSEVTEEVSEAGLDVEIIKTNNEQFPEWLGPVFTGAYIAFAANSVFSGDLEVGVFLATTRVFKELAEAFGSLYGVMISISSAFGPLKKMTYFLNLPTDGKTWKKINRARRETTAAARSEIRRRVSQSSVGTDGGDAPAAPKFASDLIQLELKDVKFYYTGSKKTDSMFNGISLKLDQGKLVAIIGPPACGKSTLLKLLGHQQFPTEGQIFIPTYLRILHVSKDPVVLAMSAWDNLTFGNRNADPKIVEKIMDGLKMDKTKELVSDFLNPGGADDDAPAEDDDDAEGQGEEEAEGSGWAMALNYVEIAKIHIARAFIMNPEILVMQRPLYHFGEASGQIVCECLKTYVDNRGLGLNPSTKDRRRPRTLFFSPTSREQARQAHVVWELTEEGNVNEKLGHLSHDKDHVADEAF